MSKFFDELKRRHVIKAAIAYLVVAWVMLQVGSFLLDTFHSPDWVQQAITIFLIIGLPIWLVISWIYDLTPKGFEKTTEEPERPEDQISSQITSKRLNLFIIVSLSIAVVLLIIRPSLFSSVSDKELAIAVIPFDNIKVDQDKEWLSQNFTQNINSYISKVQKLKVIDSYSARQYKDSGKSNNEIAEELEVSYILRGAVTQFKDQLSITVELIDIISNKVGWSESYDEKIGDDFMRLQQEISQKIVAELKIALTPTDKKSLDHLGTKSQEASIFFTEGVRIADSRTNQSMQSIMSKSANLFQKAIDIDPYYAEAYAEMAFVIRLLPEENEIFNNTNKFQKINSLLNKSLELDPNTARAYTTLGMLQAANKNFEKAKEYYDKALDIKPNDASTQHYYALYFVDKPKPDFEKALEHIKIAYELNPFSVPINAVLVNCLLHLGKTTEAEGFYKNSPVISDLEAMGRLIFEARLEKEVAEKKDWSEAIKIYRRAIDKDTIDSYLYRRLAMAYNEVLNDSKTYLKYAKKAYELGRVYSENDDLSYMSSNGWEYFFALIKNKRTTEAYDLLKDDYFRSLFADQVLVQLEFYLHYYEENYSKAQASIDKYMYYKHYELVLNYGRQGLAKKVDSILKIEAANPYLKVMAFAILKEKDSMYYYMDKEDKIEDILKINGSVELDAYRKEDRYIAFLKKNYLPITQWNK